MSQVLLLRSTLRRFAKTAEFRVSEIAKQLHCTPAQVRRLCRQTHGCLPKRLLSDWRVQMAARLLTAGKPVKFVSIEVGFRHVSSFCRYFKAVSGLRPAEFARKMRLASSIPKKSPQK